jgi:hypothetical protein
MSTSRTREKADGELFKSTGIDDNATSTAVTIDASENVLVGQTSLNTANNGHSFGANGNYAHHTSTESTTLILNRKTSDGDIVRLRKDNAAVGSIGVNGGSLIIGGGDVGIGFYQGSDALVPYNGTSATRDAAIDLGMSSARYKDAYLSGGVYLGGTGAANKLDDYEEGTWTPAGTGINTGTSVGFYTKVGNVCHTQMWIHANGSTDGTITGLPFTAGSGSSNAIAAGTIAYQNGSVTGILSGGASTTFTMYNGTATGSMASGNQMHCAMTYRTT